MRCRGAAIPRRRAIPMRPMPMLAAASSSSSTSSTSPPAPSSPLDAVSSDQALAHPTLASLDQKALERTTRYLDLVLKANSEGLNMTAVRSRGPALLRHCADSLDLLPLLDREEERWREEARNRAKNDGNDGPEKGSKVGFRVVDVGSGGGFPGAALAAARPEWHFVLIDALRKRCDAVADAVKKAGIRNAEVLWSRAEEAAAVVASPPPPPSDDDDDGKEGNSSSSSSSSSLRESSPVVVARAVAEMRTLAELCLPLVEVGGAWISPKGPPGDNSQLELEVEAARKAISLLGGEIELIETLPPLISGAPGRSVVVVRKVKGTPAKYPRGNNLPGRRPL